jgi:hypothetical protein
VRNAGFAPLESHLLLLLTSGFSFAGYKEISPNQPFKINTMRTLAIILLVVGLGLTIFTTFTYFTKEKIVDIGELEITANKPHNLNWSPLIGIGVIAVGGILFWQSNKKQ